MVVSACAELHSVKYGKAIHGLSSKLGIFNGNSAIGSSFVYMYSKCGEMDDAHVVFDEILVRDVVAWTALVIGYVQNGESEKGLVCFRDMHRIGRDNGERPNCRTFEGALQACGNLGAVLEGRCLHGLAIKTGIFQCAQAVESSLLFMYCRCGTPEEAYISFCEVSDRDLTSWTSIISVYAKKGCVRECIVLFSEMQASGVHPDEIVLSCMLLGFGNSMRISEGKAFHGYIIRASYELDQSVCNALLSMYCKFGLFDHGEKLFGGVCERNMESWNIIVDGYGRIGLETKCIELFREMQYIGVECDFSSLVTVINSCSQLGATQLGMSLHCYVIKKLAVVDISVWNSLLNMYGKCGKFAFAWSLFSRTRRDTMTWNTLISVYNQIGHFSEALSLFDKMISENAKPDSITFRNLLSACSNLASLENGERIHSYIKKEKFELNLSLATALVDMYAKCGQLERSREVFNLMKERDVIAWNVMISGYGMHGDVQSAIEIFGQMEESNVHPSEVTFLVLLAACAHAGLIKEGKYLFHRMQFYGLSPMLKHYACMVDLLGRSGDLQEAESLVLSMPIPPDSGIWGTLLSACHMHNDVEMGIRIGKQAIDSDPKNDGYYVLLSNMYWSMGKWEEAEQVRGLMKENRVKKNAGWSVT
ncbi:E motif [Dillenia turbinata]|uniref:E motif n=1 Tax=Dillenia turbinata TaxID=194707 RepID=A0AAN8UX03_9MAGN